MSLELPLKHRQKITLHRGRQDGDLKEGVNGLFGIVDGRVSFASQQVDMPTRLKKPSITNKLIIAAALLAFQGYLAHHALIGQYGVESQKQLVERKALLTTQSQLLDSRIEVAKNHNSLLVADRLDPDMLSERARGLLGWAHPSDLLIAVDQE